GHLAEFVYWNSTVMHPDLAADNQEIMTFQGFNIDSEQLTLRFDSSPLEFHGQGYSEDGLYYISPLNHNIYIIFYARNYRPIHSFDCSDDDTLVDYDDWDRVPPASPLINYGTIKRTYRLAVSATGEFTAANGGTQSAALSKI